MLFALSLHVARCALSKRPRPPHPCTYVTPAPPILPYYHTNAVDTANAPDAAVAPPPAKRLKTLGAPLRPGIIRESLLTPESAQKLRAEHDSSGPYTHVVLKDLANPDLLRAVRDEVINNVQATYKETDLFKVFQTGEA